MKEQERCQSRKVFSRNTIVILIGYIKYNRQIFVGWLGQSLKWGERAPMGVAGMQDECRLWRGRSGCYLFGQIILEKGSRKGEHFSANLFGGFRNFQ